MPLPVLVNPRNTRDADEFLILLRESMSTVPRLVFPMVRSESGDHAGIPSPENAGSTSPVLVMAPSDRQTDDTDRKVTRTIFYRREDRPGIFHGKT